MLTLEARPQTFAQMAGQELVKKALMHIVKDPKNAPKTLLLCGEFGTGKTTAARIFARALNCPNKTASGDACGVCEFCKSDIQDSMFYSEYDAALVGTTEAVKELRNTFYFGYSKGYKVIVLDEVHLVSTKAQGALLKVFEEPEENVFFLLCTTDPQKLLPTIVSRSFELRYGTVEKDKIVDHLKKVISQKGDLDLPPEELENDLNIIADRSHGHMRNAMMLLDNLYLLREDFKVLVTDSTQDFLKLINASINYNTLAAQFTEAKVQENIEQCIKKLATFPMANLKQDYEKLVLEITRHTFYKQDNPAITLITSKFKNRFDLINVLNDRSIYSMFNNEIQFTIAMICLSNKLRALKG